jgi:glycosyltransferase involved in cell wall biosynthesis
VSERPRVSVLTAAYNGEALIGDALASLSAQTFREFEAIVVDDGSTDGTASVVAEAAAGDDRIRLVRQGNGGTQAARNAALAAARGEWVALLDQDDVWKPEKLGVQVALAESDPAANLIFTNYETWEEGRPLVARYARPDKVPEGDVAVALTRGCLFQASTVMVPRALAVELGGFDVELRNAGDWDLWLRMAERGIRVRGTLTPLMLYRVWGGNESRARVRSAEEAVRMVEKALARRQTPRMRAAYARSLRELRARLAIELAGRRLDDLPYVRRALRDALAADPSPKRFLEWLAVAWPASLGGRHTSAAILSKLRRKTS